MIICEKLSTCLHQEVAVGDVAGGLLACKCWISLPSFPSGKALQPLSTRDQQPNLFDRKRNIEILASRKKLHCFQGTKFLTWGQGEISGEFW